MMTDKIIRNDELEIVREKPTFAMIDNDLWLLGLEPKTICPYCMTTHDGLTTCGNEEMAFYVGRDVADGIDYYLDEVNK